MVADAVEPDRALVESVALRREEEACEEIQFLLIRVLIDFRLLVLLEAVHVARVHDGFHRHPVGVVALEELLLAVE